MNLTEAYEDLALLMEGMSIKGVEGGPIVSLGSVGVDIDFDSKMPIRSKKRVDVSLSMVGRKQPWLKEDKLRDRIEAALEGVAKIRWKDLEGSADLGLIAKAKKDEGYRSVEGPVLVVQSSSKKLRKAVMDALHRMLPMEKTSWSKAGSSSVHAMFSLKATKTAPSKPSIVTYTARRGPGQKSRY